MPYLDHIHHSVPGSGVGVFKSSCLIEDPRIQVAMVLTDRKLAFLCLSVAIRNMVPEAQNLCLSNPLHKMIRETI